MKRNTYALSRRTFVKGVVAPGTMLYGMNLSAFTNTIKKLKLSRDHEIYSL